MVGKEQKRGEKTSKKPFARSAKLSNQKHFTSIQNEVISKRIMSINPIFFNMPARNSFNILNI